MSEWVIPYLQKNDRNKKYVHVICNATTVQAVLFSLNISLWWLNSLFSSSSRATMTDWIHTYYGTHYTLHYTHTHTHIIFQFSKNTTLSSSPPRKHYWLLWKYNHLFLLLAPYLFKFNLQHIRRSCLNVIESEFIIQAVSKSHAMLLLQNAKTSWASPLLLHITYYITFP